MVVRLNTTLRDQMANAIPSVGTLYVRTGSQPTSADSAMTGTLLVQIDNVTFSAAASGGRSLVSTAVGTATTAGTAAYARFTDGTRVVDGSVGLTTASDFVISSTVLALGDVVTVQQMSLTMPV